MSNALVSDQTRTTLYTTGERVPNTPRPPGFNAWYICEETLSRRCWRFNKQLASIRGCHWHAPSFSWIGIHGIYLMFSLIGICSTLTFWWKLFNIKYELMFYLDACSTRAKINFTFPSIDAWFNKYSYIIPQKTVIDIVKILMRIIGIIGHIFIRNYHKYNSHMCMISNLLVAERQLIKYCIFIFNKVEHIFLWWPWINISLEIFLLKYFCNCTERNTFVLD